MELNNLRVYRSAFAAFAPGRFFIVVGSVTFGGKQFYC